MDAAGAQAPAVEDRSIAGPERTVRLRLYRPQAAGPVPCVLYFHGGGFTGGAPETDEAAASFIAEAVPALVISVAYSLAPEHPFPAAVLDAYEAAQWVQAQAGRLGVTAAGLGVAGHEAGGHVAASLTFLARDRGDVSIAAQALLGPMLDPSLTRVRQAAAPRGVAFGQSIAECSRCYRAYLPDPSSRMHPYAAPLDSRRLGHLPPALIVTAQDAALRMEAESYAECLAQAGIRAEVKRFPDASQASLSTHRPALAAVSEFFRRRLARAGGN
ncbi:alpha/beta hydrolase [Arenibaculum pallidiluteum]|uniref:alpha/beta hydrolase n=1 Tax=Arenibaculum pallidiluteum TaxID=2812559 RepID=UPI001A96B374|nr:alpha/beta hydrolase [Arenibaculum pallidiluteum]